MSRSEDLFKWRTMKVPKRSGFNKSYQNLFTMPVGTLTPLLCDEVIPNTRVNLTALISANLPPLASSTFMRCRICSEAFFVPMRILYGGFQSWYTQEQIYDTTTSTYKIPVLPRFQLSASSSSLVTILGPGSLADYLGFKFTNADLASIAQGSSTFEFNIFPFLAYHRIYDDFYRNSQVTKPLFSRPFSGATPSLAAMPYQAYSTAPSASAITSFASGQGNLFTLRQRNFDIDYFTSATPSAQQGNAQKVTVVSNEFTIASLRAANSLQLMLERANLAGFRLTDYVKANFGAYLSDGQAQRPIYLGSGSFDVYSKGIYQNNNNNTTATGSGLNNPFSKSVGAEYGSAFAGGKLNLIDDFTVSEPGYIFVMISLVPHATYSTGVLKQNLRLISSSSPAEMGFPSLQNMGNEPIFLAELDAYDAFINAQHVFGYTDRFASYMCREDELHGLLRDGESLQSFALQRTASGTAYPISTGFLEIPKTFLDQVAAASAGVSGYGAWVDSYLDYRITMPLHQYSTPSLQDPAEEHGTTIRVQRGGSRL